MEQVPVVDNGIGGCLPGACLRIGCLMADGRE